jgi:hypothetical protein
VEADGELAREVGLLERLRRRAVEPFALGGDLGAELLAREVVERVLGPVRVEQVGRQERVVLDRLDANGPVPGEPPATPRRLLCDALGALRVGRG